MRPEARPTERRRTAVPGRGGTRFADLTGAAHATGGTGGTGPTSLAAAISLVVTLGLAAALVPALLLGLATPASAHSRLVTTTPMADSTLTAPPHEIILTFNEPVSPRYTNVAVTAADGAGVTAGATRVEGGTVHQGLTALRDGRYTVAYRVVSEDGHPVGGEFAFTVAGSTASAGQEGSPPPSPVTTTPTPAATASPTTGAAPAPSAAVTAVTAVTADTGPADGGGGSSGGGGGGGWILPVVIAGILTLGGGTLFALRRRHSGAR